MDETPFQTLLNRPEYSRSSDDIHFLEQQNADTVTIPRLEYEDLCRLSCHFRKLKASLIDGGLSLQTLDVLIYGAQSSTTRSVHADYQKPVPGQVTPVTQEPLATGDAVKESRHQNGQYNAAASSDDGDDGFLSQGSDEKDDDQAPPSGRSSAAPAGQRTVSLRNLPDWVSFEQITEAVRGGALLHIYLRGRERIVNVSFVEEDSAQDFLNYAKSQGIYIGGKPVEASWNDRQFYLPPYVRHKIHAGATRNIIINNVSPNITEALIRRDLAHIHNLVIVSVRFGQGNAYISTNSVHNALFARSCMISRLTYKGMRIGFFADECDQPLLRGVPSVSPASASTKSNAGKGLAKTRDAGENRFQLLSLDGVGDESCEDDGLNGLPLDGIGSADGATV